MGITALKRLRDVRAAAVSGRARQIRISAGLTQKEISEVVGVRQATIALWEAGKRVPRGEPALKYANVLEALTSGAEDARVAG